MNPFSMAANVLKGAITVAELAGMCKGCLIRKPGGPPACESCGAMLCPNCVSRMIERNRDHNARARRIPGTPGPESNVLNCEARSGDWGHV
jgi:hypothetical protein